MPDSERVVFPEPGTVRIEDHEVDDPGPGELLVRSERSLISIGTELTALSGEYPEGSQWDDVIDYPTVPGYDNVGTVVAAGEGAAQWEGRRVATRGPHARLFVTDADDCLAVPEAVESEAAAFFTLAEIAMNGVRRSRLTWGEAAVVYGLGSVGQLAARFCREAGARPVLGVDLAPERLEYLPAGIEGVAPGARDPADAVRAANRDRLAPVVFEVTGSPGAITGEFDVLREQGRLVVLSSPRGETAVDFHDHCNAPSYEIIGAHNSSHPPVATPANPWTRERHDELFFDLVADGTLSMADLVSHREPYARAPELYRGLLEDRTGTMGVVLEWE
jgi:2-desacetyl-2-hydroxyethyl bacteriochlorophyllide A dehydrogenase